MESLHYYTWGRLVRSIYISDLTSVVNCAVYILQDTLEQYISKWLVFSLIWSFTGDGKFKIRNELGDFIRSSTTIALPPANTDIIDYEVRAQAIN